MSDVELLATWSRKGKAEPSEYPMLSTTNNLFIQSEYRLRRFLGVFTGIHSVLVMVDQIEPTHSSAHSTSQPSPRNKTHQGINPIFN
jgi:hypothetical protein